MTCTNYGCGQEKLTIPFVSLDYFFGRKLTSDLDSGGLKPSESVKNVFLPWPFGLAKFLD
jgi:hypothetical protein